VDIYGEDSLGVDVFVFDSHERWESSHTLSVAKIGIKQTEMGHVYVALQYP
jgi:hypothetical protein